MIELGILRSVSPRTKWANEARDFTPWLFENIDLLGNALGIDLAAENMEVPVGPFFADILAKDTGSGHNVVIENQLEKTDHDHLGKALTYAAVLDANAIIWVSTKFTDEHKKALDWLNDHCGDKIAFYGVQLELWQIDNSNPAIKFNIISQPNDAVVNTARAIASEDLTENRKIQWAFWSKFKDKLLLSSPFSSLQTPRPQNWFDISLGRTHIHLSNVCNPEQNKVAIRVYIHNRIADSMLPYLESRKTEIETLLGESLQWNPFPEKRDKVIVLNKSADFQCEESVQEALDWLVNKTIDFKRVFSKIVTEERRDNHPSNLKILRG